jgi:hypothetical protein
MLHLSDTVLSSSSSPLSTPREQRLKHRPRYVSQVTRKAHRLTSLNT